ncbi:MAG TPA: nucleotidyltransferase domain-containing protein [Kiritimatiellia bacterium]|nr:nucleotidyltransferase domain-containing protein [Kiritimatiellia bacterium]
MSDPFGLAPDVRSQIHDVLSRHPEIRRTMIYGSRAQSRYRPGSDIDLVIEGEKVSSHLLSQLFVELDDLMLPYTFDLSDFSAIENETLRQTIRQSGQVFYERK